MLVTGCISVSPTITSYLQSPQIIISQNMLHISDDQFTSNFLVKNKGNGIATDLFIQIQTYKGDKVFLPMAVAHEISTIDSITWNINIHSLAPDEHTSIMVFSTHVDDLLSVAADLRKLDRLPSGLVSSIFADYREGRIEDIEFADSPEYESHLRDQLEELLP